MENNHQYITFSEKAKSGSNSEVSKRIISNYCPKVQTLKKWKKDTRYFTIKWTDCNKKEQISKPTNYIEIAKFIRENGYFDNKYYNLAPLECFWLDISLDAKIDFHIFDQGSPNAFAIRDGVSQQQYGKDYPIHQMLSREGHAYTSLQSQLMKRIVSMRTALIKNSNKALTDDWFFDLRSLINDTISLVEITLTQFYIKAEYDPLETWNFDKEQLGERHGRKFNDKLNWIYKITGNDINAELFMPSFTFLRELRNHMMHFDPPSLIVTLEEATVWLNYIIDVGYLLIKIRDAIGAEVSIQLLNFILQKEAVFNPEECFSKRLPITDNADYASSNWPKQK